jgi:hypothetical protein
MEIFLNWMYCFPFLVYCSMFGLMSFFLPWLGCSIFFVDHGV